MAGETTRIASNIRLSSVHPRVCGGNELGGHHDESHAGPSPRVRGKRPHGDDGSRDRGSIPACAGETPEPLGITLRPAVHPRVCGGNSTTSASAEIRSGPSPRVRGKRRIHAPTKACRRSIPACAGETIGVSYITDSPWVHPRVCGGNPHRRELIRLAGGPSPRVRGKPEVEMLAPRRGRSIPACAGETPPCPHSSKPFQVHPRVCGGNTRMRQKRSQPQGPSPRVRGKRTTSVVRDTPLGSIPACAGETVLYLSPTGLHAGPSPRVRGKPSARGCASSVMGSIPACAGGNSGARGDGRSGSGPSPRVRGKLVRGLCG